MRLRLNPGFTLKARAHEIRARFTSSVPGSISPPPTIGTIQFDNKRFQSNLSNREKNRVFFRFFLRVKRNLEPPPTKK